MVPLISASQLDHINYNGDNCEVAGSKVFPAHNSFQNFIKSPAIIVIMMIRIIIIITMMMMITTPIKKS